jgi:hypothetical protein
MNNFLRKDPSVVAPITNDSIYGVKRKVQKNAEDQDVEVKRLSINFFLISIVIYNYIE